MNKKVGTILSRTSKFRSETTKRSTWKIISLRNGRKTTIDFCSSFFLDKLSYPLSHWIFGRLSQQNSNDHNLNNALFSFPRQFGTWPYRFHHFGWEKISGFMKKLENGVGGRQNLLYSFPVCSFFLRLSLGQLEYFILTGACIFGHKGMPLTIMLSSYFIGFGGMLFMALCS